MGAALLVLAAAPLPAAASEAAGRASRAPQTSAGSGLVMVLDSSGSMAEDDGTGRTRMESARQAVGTVVDALPDGHPTGLRVYGADRPSGCTDTRAVLPVRPLDRAGLKDAVRGVRPGGDSPVGLALTEAARDLPATPGRTVATRTILLVSDGEDTCGGPRACEVAARLAGADASLRVDTVGFQVGGAAREELECVARAGHGRYHDAPDADALARQLQRSAGLSADGYRFRGAPAAGTPGPAGAPLLVPGRYLDTIGPGERRHYAVDLDARSTVTFAATAVPRPGTAVGPRDGLRTRIAYGTEGSCGSRTEYVGQDEGAAPLTSAVTRVPTPRGGGRCDRAGGYRLVVERESGADTDSARWPLELAYEAQEPLAEGVTPAQSRPGYGSSADAVLPAGDPTEIAGGTGFNDAEEIADGVWRDALLPSQTLWYKVPVGWGQQLRYDVEFGNEPPVDGGSAARSYGATQVYTPARVPVGPGAAGFSRTTAYDGRPAVLEMGTVPVAWTNRHEHHPNVVPVHTAGDFYIAVTLGAKAAEIARNARIAVVLRVAVLGDELAGPQHDAPVRAGGGAGAGDNRGDSAAGRDSAPGAGAGWSGAAQAAAVGGGAVLAATVLAVLLRRRAAATGPHGRATDAWTDSSSTRRSA
ncbi:VWA domain-containing protein [Streptomyces sp. t39]|nr:VWA domain-containing protein [Streptomyces sp. t39]